MRRDDGRLVFDPIPGSEFDMPVDLVLLAMGFLGPERTGMLSELGVKLTERGNVWRDETWMTTVPGVFTAGDMQRGQSAHSLGDRRWSGCRSRGRRLPDGDVQPARASLVAVRRFARRDLVNRTQVLARSLDAFQSWQVDSIDRVAPAPRIVAHAPPKPSAHNARRFLT